MFTAARASGPKTRKGRPGKSGPITNMLSNSVDADSTDALRLQRLRLLGVIGARADLIATLAWGEAA